MSETFGAQRFLYHTKPGRALLKILVCPWVSKAGGAFLSCGLSKVFIAPFIAKNGIDMSPYPQVKYRHFNDFFTREISCGARPIDMDKQALIAPCDSLLSVYDIDEKSRFFIKNSSYSTGDLLGGNTKLAHRFQGGKCLIFRLTVTDYHRYCYLDSGTKEESVFVPGVLHTVNPIALDVVDIYAHNAREYTVLHTQNFGDVAQIEVGALMVGKICNHPHHAFVKGQEKGMFLFGGSTVVVLLEQGRAAIQSGFGKQEVQVYQGQRIGERIEN